MVAIRAFRATQHSQIFHFSLEIQFNALCFINYTITQFPGSAQLTPWLLWPYQNNFSLAKTSIQD